MSTTQYTYLVSNPHLIASLDNDFLEKIITDFPYFQSARALQLKNLFNQNSFKYNQKLRKTAAYTADRSVLFDFITSEKFVSIQKSYHIQNQPLINNINVKDHNEMFFEKKTDPDQKKTNQEVTIAKLEQSIKESITESYPTNAYDIEFIKKERGEQSLDTGKPLNFAQNEKHSFHEWLQLAHITPINRDEASKIPQEKIIFSDKSKRRNQAIIDKFIETNPKITPIKNYTPPINIEKASEDNSHIMTETLAKVYLEQKKYQKAIQAYEILILKYPEKFSFFANRISEIRNLQ